MDQGESADPHESEEEDTLHMITIRLRDLVPTFAEDKDAAREIRKSQILPKLDVGESVCLDFNGITASTQSFIHALIGEPLHKYGEGLLDRVEFRNCKPQVKSVIEIVVDYSLGGFKEQK